MADPIPSYDEIAAKLQVYREQNSPQPSAVQAPPIPVPSYDEVATKLETYRQAQQTKPQVDPSVAFPQGPAEQPNAKKLGTLESIGELGAKIPRPNAQQIQELAHYVAGNLGDKYTPVADLPVVKPEDVSPVAKAASGILEANNKALAYVAVLGPTLGLVSKASPLIGRLISTGTAIDIGAHLPDMYRQIEKSVNENDVEGTARGVAEMGLGAFFAAQSARHGLGPGAALESPMLNRFLEGKIKTDYSPEQVKDIYGRVNRGEGTPAEQELVRFLNKNVESPGQIVRKGATVEETVKNRFNAPKFNEYMGVNPPGTRTVSVGGSPSPSVQPPTTEESNAPIRQIEQRVQEQPAQEANQQVTPEAPTQVPQDVAGNRATTVIPVEQKLPFETVAPGEEIPESGAWVGRSVDYHFHDPEGRWPDKKSTGKIVSIFRGPNMESGRPRISVRIRWQNGTESEHGSSAGRGPSGIVNATQAVGAALKSGGVTIRDEPSPAEVPRTSPAEPEAVAVQPEQSQSPVVKESLTAQLPIPEPKIGDKVSLHGYRGVLSTDETGKRVIDTGNALVEVNEGDSPRFDSGITDQGKVVFNGQLYEPAVGAKKPWRNAWNEQSSELRLRDRNGRTLRIRGPEAVFIAQKFKALEERKPQRIKRISEDVSTAGINEADTESVDTPVDEFLLNKGIERETPFVKDIGPVAQQPLTTQPPPEAVQIATELNRPLVKATGPDGQQYWFTFDGYHPEHPGIGPLTTLAQEKDVTAPGLTERGSYAIQTLEKKGWKFEPVPTFEQWQQSSKRASLPIDTMPREVVPSAPQLATGVQEIHDLLPKSGLDEKTQGVIKAFLGTPVAQQLDLSKLRLEVKDLVDVGGKPAAGSFLDGVIELSRSSSDPETFVHEVGHLLFDMLSPADKALVRKWRLEEIKRLYGNDAPAALESGNTTSAQFVQSGMPRADYHLSNDSEYFTHTFTEGFSKDHEADPEAQSFSQKVRAWLKALWDSIKQFFGSDPTKEQFVRDILSGKRVTTPESGVKFEEKRASFSRTKKDAENREKISQEEEERTMEGFHQMAQSSDLIRFMEKYGASKLSPRAMKLLRYPELMGIKAVGNGLLGKDASYRELKRIANDPWRVTDLARVTSGQLSVFEKRGDRMVAKRDAEEVKMLSEPWLKLVEKSKQARQNLDLAALKIEVQNLAINSAIEKAQRALRDESLSDGEIEYKRGQIAELEKLKQSSFALNQVLTDMTNVLASTPDGLDVLMGDDFPTRTDIVKVYTDIKKSKEQPLHDKNLIRQSAYLIQRSPILRDALVAEYLSSDSAVRADMDGYETRLTHDLKTKPATTIKALRRDYGKLTSSKEKAKFLWQALNKKVMKRADAFNAINDAAEAYKSILNDPEYKALATEIRKDSGSLGDTKPMEVFTSESILLPDGTEVNVKPEYWSGARELFTANRERLETAVSTLKTWLNNPENMGHRNFRIFERNLATIETYYMGLSLTVPNDMAGTFEASFGAMWAAADLVGGRMGAPLKRSIQKYEEMHRQASLWKQQWSFQLTNAMAAAMRSHKLEWMGLGTASLTDVSKTYRMTVGNVLAWSHNRQFRGYRVNETLPTGEVVTKEDMALLHLMSEAATQAYKIQKRVFPNDPPYLMEEFSGMEFYRDPAKTSEFMTPAGFDQDVFEIGKGVSAIRDKWIKAEKEKDQTAVDAAQKELVKFFNDYWSVIGVSMVADRLPGKATEFDGTDGAFKYLKEGGEAIPAAHEIDSFDDFVTKLGGLTAHTEKEVLDIILPEWERMISSWYQKAKLGRAAGPTVPVAEEKSNSFTRARKTPLAPYVFYENGFKSVDSLMHFGSAMQSRALDEVLAAWTAVHKDLIAQKDRYKIEVKKLMAQGVPNAEALVKAKAKMDRFNGDNFDRLSDLDSRIYEAARQIEILSGRDPHDPDIIAGRYIGVLTGQLIGIGTTAKNLWMGPMQLGDAARRIIGSNIAAYPVAVYLHWIKVQLPFVASGAYSALKVALWDLPKGTLVGTWKALFNPTHGQRSRTFVKELLTPALQEIAQGMFNRLKVVRMMRDAGIMEPAQAMEIEADARFFASAISGGRILDNNLTFMQQVKLVPASLLEMLFLVPNKVNPKYGDVAYNAGVVHLGRSSIGYGAWFEKVAIELAERYKKGERQFDFERLDNPINAISYKELYPKGWDFYPRLMADDVDKAFARQMHERAGLDLFDLMVRRVQQHVKGEATGRFYTPEQQTAMDLAIINFSNASTVANSPAFAKSKHLLSRLITPFFPWGIRQLTNFLQLFSVSGQKEGKRAENMKQLRWLRAQQYAWVLVAIVFAHLLMSALIGPGSNAQTRILKETLYNQVLPYRQPWERDGVKSQALGWAIEGLQAVPIVGGAISMAINDVPARASLDPNVVLLQKAKDALNYAGGVIQTGDITYKLPEFIIGMVPDARIILSRVPGFEGKQELNNASSLLRRYGPMDSMNPMGRAVGGLATELTPYGDRMANAAIKGDMESFQQIYQEAVAKATELGKANPERVVKEMFASRNPYTRVFKGKLTDSEREQLLQKASPEERALIEGVEQKFSQAMSSIGGNVAFTSEQSAANRSSRSGGGSSGYVSAASGGAGSELSGSASTRRTGSRFGGIRSRGTRRSRLGTRRRSIGGRVKSSLRIGKGMRSRSIKSSKRRSLSLASLR